MLVLQSTNLIINGLGKFPNMLKFIIISLILVRFTNSFLFPFTSDEAYYWLWSRHLDWSYVDHPPLISYINKLFTFISPNEFFSVRIASFCFFLLICWAVYLLAQELFSKKTALLSVAILVLIPNSLTGLVPMTVEVPLILFYVLSCYFFIKALKQPKNNRNWVWLGIMLGLGLLSKFTMILFGFSALIFLLSAKQYRFLLSSFYPYLSILIAIMCFFPVLYWNYIHNFVSFNFHISRVGKEVWGAYTFEFLLNQILYYSPILIFFSLPAFFYTFKNRVKRENYWLLFCFSFPIFLLFFILSLKTRVWPHWPVISYFPSLILTSAFISYRKLKLRRFLISFLIFDFLLLIGLSFVYPGVLLRQNSYTENKKIYQRLEKAAGNGFYLFADYHGSLGQLSYYCDKPVYFPQDESLANQNVWGAKQFRIWGSPLLQKGDNIVYFGNPDNRIKSYLERKFEKVYLLDEIKLNVLEDHIRKKVFWVAKGYKGTRMSIEK